MNRTFPISLLAFQTALTRASPTVSEVSVVGVVAVVVAVVVETVAVVVEAVVVVAVDVAVGAGSTYASIWSW